MVFRNLNSMRLLIGAVTWFALVAFVSGVVALSASAAPQVIGPVEPSVFNGDVRGLLRSTQLDHFQPGIEIPKQTYPRPASTGPVRDVASAQQPAESTHQEPRVSNELRVSEAFSMPLLNFAGQGYSGVNPPDTIGDVGPNHYIQMINGPSGAIFQIFDKSGNLLAGPTDLDTLGTGNCAYGHGDPVVLYDRLADRWVLLEFSDSANALCFYVSQTSDPIVGGFFNYEFGTPEFPDYPKVGVWPDAYYVSTNESSPTAYAMDRSQMLAGLAATSQRFTAPSLAGFPFQALLPSDLDGPNAPPAGAPNYFMRHRDDEVHNAGFNDPTQDFLEIFEFSVDFANPANSTFTGPNSIAISEIDSDLCGLSSFSCFPQPAPGPPLDPLREVVMWRLQYRNFGATEVMVGNLVTDVDGTDHGGVRWFELNKAGPSWFLNQEGTHAPDSDHRWMGSIAMDQNGNIALGFSVASASLFPSIRYVGRLSTDPFGTLPQGEFNAIAGTGPSSSIRWGDYSAMSVDPVDDCTFWYTNEYGAGASTGSNCCLAHAGTGCDDSTCEATICGFDPYCCNVQWDGICVAEAIDYCPVCSAAAPWGTQITVMKFDACGPTATPTVTPTATPTPTPTPPLSGCRCVPKSVTPGGNLATLKNVATGGKGSRTVRILAVKLEAEDVTHGSCPRGATSNPVAVSLRIEDDDGDVLIDRSKSGFVCIGQQPVFAKFAVSYEGPKNCKDSAVPTGNVSHGDLYATVTMEDGFLIPTRRISCKR